MSIEETISKLVKKPTNKPKLMIKKVKGHKYLQLSDLHGNLIHIGSADSLENWVVGLKSLEENYKGFALIEALKLDGEKVFQALEKYDLDPKNIPDDWARMNEKRIQVKVDRELITKILHRIPEDQMTQELVDYRTNLMSILKTSEISWDSPDRLEVVLPLGELQVQRKESGTPAPSSSKK